MHRRARLGFGITNVLVGAFVLCCVFLGLPARYWLVDGGAIIIAGAWLSSGAALLYDHKLAAGLTRIAAWLVLGLGLGLFATLCWTAAWLAGVYGPIGKGGAAIFGLVAALVLPYLVALPVAELLLIGPRTDDIR